MELDGVNAKIERAREGLQSLEADILLTARPGEMGSCLSNLIHMIMPSSAIQSQN